VVEGRTKSAEQQQLTGQQGSRISALISADQDTQSAITLPTAIADANASPGTQIGDKHSNPDAAGLHMSRQRINRIFTGPRHKSNKLLTSTIDRRVLRVHTIQVHHSTCEMDSHAETCVAGPNTVILEYTDQMVSVSAFSDLTGEQLSPVVITKWGRFSVRVHKQVSPSCIHPLGVDTDAKWACAPIWLQIGACSLQFGWIPLFVTVFHAKWGWANWGYGDQLLCCKLGLRCTLGSGLLFGAAP
jgi:hypothetical protein